MLSCTLLAKLPAEWQEKMHREIAAKLRLCIPDDEQAKNVTADTWRHLSQENLSTDELSLKLKQYLPDHAPHFAEWVMDFAQKTIEYYLETVAPGRGNGDAEAGEGKTQARGETETDKEAPAQVFKRALAGLSTKTHRAKKPVDPLDDTLDNLILKEKIAKLQGHAGAPLGVQTKSGRFRQGPEPRAAARKKPRTKSPGFRNLTLVNADQAAPRPEAEAPRPPLKVPKLCMNFPKCEFGDSCRYVHPAGKICKNWPDCFYGDKCAFVHPDK